MLVYGLNKNGKYTYNFNNIIIILNQFLKVLLLFVKFMNG